MSRTLVNPNAARAVRLVFGGAVAQRAASILVAECVEFHVEPLPEDRWEFTTKAEARHALVLAVVDARREVTA